MEERDSSERGSSGVVTQWYRHRRGSLGQLAKGVVALGVVARGVVAGKGYRLTHQEKEIKGVQPSHNTAAHTHTYPEIHNMRQRWYRRTQFIATAEPQIIPLQLLGKFFGRSNLAML